MEIFEVEDYDRMSRRAARSVARQILYNHNSVLGLPTGNTPTGMYEELELLYRQGLIDFSSVTAFNLDEYYRLPPEDERSFYSYMEEYFYDRVNVRDENCHIPDGNAEDPKRECKDYERKIKDAGGIDLMVLGIGVNGHIAFNEPGSPLGSPARMVELAEGTKSRNFSEEEEGLNRALTLGIRNIMQSEEIILLASGERKAEIIEKTLNEEITPEIPSTVLRLHPRVSLILDREAAELI